MRAKTINTLRATLLALAALAFAAPVARAQYFGRNKVQYEGFKFEVLKTEHFDIMYYPEAKGAAEIASRLAERWYTRLSKTLDHQLSKRQVVIFYASHPDFEQTNAIPGELDEGTGGVTEALKRRIVLPFAGPLAETDHVLGHELVHAFQYDISGQGRSVANPAGAALERMPLWFVEGMAEYLSLGPVDPNTAMWMRDALDSLPEIRKLDNPKYFPYRWGQAFWSYVGGRWGDDVVGRLLKRAAAVGSIQQAFIRTLGIPDSTLSSDWHEAIKAAYEPVATLTKGPSEYADPVFVRTEGAKGGYYNIAPALSPDGKSLMFISERDQFSIEMFLADVGTRTVTRKITKTAVDPHFESLQFINSAGAWSSDGEQFVFSGVRQGRPVLSILNAKNGNIDREIPLNDLGEVFNPSWSPDGRYIAFSALAGGVMDLFIYDLQESVLKRMTNDAYAELQPAWSPDGKSIAFVTDRFTSDLARLRMGNYRLAAMDPASGAIRALPSFGDSKNINPQWAPDGSSVYFVSDHNGISNIFRIELASGTISQVTDLYTGVSGITDLSPTLSVSLKSNVIAFSVFRKGAYGIYTMNSAEVMAGKEPRVSFPQGNPGVLPPANRDPAGVVAMLDDAGTGLPATGMGTDTPYHTSMSLDYIGQPHLAAGVDSWGTFIGGGASAFWSDMLGNHNLATVLEVQGTYKDITAAVAYTNLTRRMNWGIIAQQSPYVTGGFATGIGQFNGQPVYVEQLVRSRQTGRDFSLLAAYPFNRVRRIEFQGGVSNITFSQEVRQKSYQLIGAGFIGQQVDDTTYNLPTPANLTMATGSAALVYDNSLFGATGPIMGQRYRMEVAPMVGSLKLAELSADYRKYIMFARPFTWATRVMHRGRYGPDAESTRLFPLYIGYQALVRGYPQSSFQNQYCAFADPSCLTFNFDQLLGSKVLVANTELRFPLFGVLGLGSGYYGGVPIDMVLFGDAGMAWSVADKAWFLGGTRKPVYSVGAALRLNLLGFAILELDATRPLSRAELTGSFWSKIVWQVGLTQGF